jgi:hypothetical protein
LEPYDGGIRLVVYHDGTECVCRKERPGRLRKFLEMYEAQAFRGRLQLFIQEEHIVVTVKGQAVGNTTSKALNGLLEEALL